MRLDFRLEIREWVRCWEIGSLTSVRRGFATLGVQIAVCTLVDMGHLLPLMSLASGCWIWYEIFSIVNFVG